MDSRLPEQLASLAAPVRSCLFCFSDVAGTAREVRAFFECKQENSTLAAGTFALYAVCPTCAGDGTAEALDEARILQAIADARV